MPIYEYVCRECSHRFDALVRGKETPSCPSCRSEALERLLSVPAVRSETTHGLAMAAAKKRDKAQALDNMHERLNYENSHDRHGH